MASRGAKLKVEEDAPDMIASVSSNLKKEEVDPDLIGSADGNLKGEDDQPEELSLKEYKKKIDTVEREIERLKELQSKEENLRDWHYSKFDNFHKFLEDEVRGRDGNNGDDGDDKLIPYQKRLKDQMEVIRSVTKNAKHVLSTLQDQRLTVLTKHLEEAESAKNKLIEDEKVRAKKRCESPHFEEWFERVSADVSAYLEKRKERLNPKPVQVAIFIEPEDSFGYFKVDGRGICRFGAESQHHFLVLMSPDTLWIDGNNYEDCSEAVKRGLPHYQPHVFGWNRSIFIALDWNIQPKDNDYYGIFWGDYTDELRNDWPDIQKRALKGPWTSPQLALILERIWSLIRREDKNDEGGADDGTGARDEDDETPKKPAAKRARRSVRGKHS